MKIFTKIWIGVTILIAVIIIWMYLSVYLMPVPNHPPEKCALEEELSCDIYAVFYDEKEIMLDINNGYEGTIEVKGLTISRETDIGKDEGAKDPSWVCNSEEVSEIIKSGLKKEIRFRFKDDCDLIDKEYAKYLLQLEINKVDMDLDRTIEGVLVSKADGYVLID